MPYPMTCEHFQGGQCAVASQLAGGKVTFDTRACAVCDKQERPREVNKVTVDIAVHWLRKNGQAAKAVAIYNDFHGINPPVDDGSGSRFGDALRIDLPWFNPEFQRGCLCKDFIAIMNRWPPEQVGDRDHKAKAIRWLRKTADHHGVTVSETEIHAAVAKAIRLVKPRRAPRNDRWTVAVTTAPRKDCTLRKCVESIRACGWEPVVFAEPDSTVTNCETVQNPEKRGIWHNWLHSAKWSLENTTSELILTVQDDALFHPDSRTFAESVIWPREDAGFLSLYTPKHYTIRRDKTIRDPGVNRIYTRSLWGACALVWDRDVLQQVVDHPVAKNWTGAATRSRSKSVIERRRANPHLIANSDTAIGKILNRMKRTMWFVDPSPVQHIARHSTISHGDNTGRRNAWRIADHDVPLADQVFPTESPSKAMDK